MATRPKCWFSIVTAPIARPSRRLGENLAAAGFTNVRRYQLGIPVWRALGGPVEIELGGIKRIFKADQTAVYFDTRPATEFAKGSLPVRSTHPPTMSSLVS